VANVPIAELVKYNTPSEKTFAAIAYVISPIAIPAVGVSVSTVITSAKGSYGQSGCKSGTNAEARSAPKTTTTKTTTPESTAAVKPSTSAVKTASTSSTAKAPRISLTRQSNGTRNSCGGKSRNAESP
jgi:hypothetical protein